MKFILIPLLILMGAISGCTPRPQAPELAEKGGIAVAKAGDIILTDQYLLGRISNIEKKFPRIYSTHVQKKNLLTEMMNVELLYQEALRQGYTNRYEFKSRMADLYVLDLAEKARSTISEKRLLDYFSENKKQIERISARHILLKFLPGMSSSTKAELKKKLETLRAEAIQKPDTFADLAKQNSEDGTKDSGGELGFFTFSSMVVPFSTAAFNLKTVGDISPVVESEFGYHIIQLSGDQRGFENYKELIQDQLARQTQKEWLNTELERLKKGKDFTIYEENLVKLSPLPDIVNEDPDKLLPPGSVNENKK